MKNLTLLLGIILFSLNGVYAQKDHAGMEGDMDKINAQANINLAQWKSEIAKEYSVSEEKVGYMHSTVKMTPGDIVVALEIAKISSRTNINQIIQMFKGARTLGWAELSKLCHIKPGSTQMDTLKANVGKKAKSSGSNG